MVTALACLQGPVQSCAALALPPSQGTEAVTVGSVESVGRPSRGAGTLWEAQMKSTQMKCTAGEAHAETEREREERSSIYWFTLKCLQWLGLGQAEAKSSEFIWIFHVSSRNSTTWVIIRCLPGCEFAGSWDWEWSWNWSPGTLMGCRHPKQHPNH